MERVVSRHSCLLLILDLTIRNWFLVVMHCQTLITRYQGAAKDRSLGNMLWKLLPLL